MHQKLRMLLLYAPAIYSKESKSASNRDTYILMFIAALFTIHNSRKQPRCPLADEGIKKMWHKHNRVLFSHNKNEIMSFALK
jgi:hypothetical protein